MRRANASAPTRLARPVLSELSGHWEDADSAAGPAAGLPITLRGWARCSGGQPAIVRCELDGIEVAAVVVDRDGRWEMSISTTPADAGSLLTVTASSHASRVALGVVRLASPAVSARGHIDAPGDRAVVTVGGILSVSGWVLFDGAPADRIEAYVGDEPPVRLRRAQPRVDVAAAMSGRAGGALASGFTGMMSVPARWQDTTIRIQLRATMSDGRTWCPPAIRVRTEARPEHGSAPDTGDPTLAATAPAHPLAAGGPMRICVFTHSLLLGGGELYLQELLLRLKRDYPIEVLVVSPADGPLKQQLRDAGIAVHLTREYSTTSAYYFGRVEELALLIRAWGADLVLGNTLGVFAAIDAATVCGVPAVWAIHESFELGVFSYLNWGEHGLHPTIEARWRRCLTAAHTVFEAETTRDQFANQVPGLQGRRISYGIDLGEIARYRQHNDRTALRAELGIDTWQTVMLCMGIFQERKAQLAIVIAFARIAALFPDALLVLVGDHPTPYARAVRDAIDDLGLSARVRIVGIQPDTYRWYHVSDMMISASDTESLPRSLLEAMAFGVPTLAADVFGLSEVIDDGLTGWLCQPLDGAALVVGMRRALSCSAQDRSRMSQACLARSAAFDGAHYASEYFELMKNLVATHRLQRAAPTEA